ncbi:ASCH domain-containing protein [Streptomyces sp. JJ38]|uniref:ASCH domain-containing protein n=1 Tax=Streptomyces sp. JJ38 TaxID=2738128 RepID=UPI001C572267|nr:ASCH domain-containing protein [Streptomyces sp. JJ38]MBW1598600.1 ASCH domain-containing protein [Streptomyces sp. JJ38]
MTHPDELPRAEFAFPGPLRDQLVAAILSGAKTSTTSLAAAYDAGEEPLPVVGERRAVVDSRDRPVAVIEVTGVRRLTVGEVDLQHALDEGENHTTVAQWRAEHERFWHSEPVRRELGDPHFTVTDATPVIAERFRVVEVLG